MTDDEYWTALEQAGWLAFVSGPQVDELRQALAERTPESRHRALAMGGFDSECIEDEESYTLAETGVAERFFMLPSSDQMVHLVFVPAAAFERALEMGVVPRETKPPLLDFDEDELDAHLQVVRHSDDPDKAVASMHEVLRMLHMSMTPEDLAEIAEMARQRQKKE